MKVHEIQIEQPEELACELTETIAAQVFAVCALDDSNQPLDSHVREMGVNITPQDLVGSQKTLRRIIQSLIQPSDEWHSLSDQTILALKRLSVILQKVMDHTYVHTTEDAWTSKEDDDD